jgi:neutral ceramidase
MRYTVAVTLTLALFLCLSTGAAYAQADEPGPLRVGIATADVTPDSPALMRGFGGRNRPSEGVAKNILAQAVVFDNGQTRVALVAVDHCWIEYRQALDLRAAAEAAGIPQQHLMINFSHNHYGPFFTACVDRSPGFNLEYDVLFKQRTDPLLAAAVEDLKPALLDYTVGSSTMAINRRQLDDENKWVGMRPEPRKQIDPDVPVLRVLTPEGEVRAVIFGYACHPTTISGQMQYLIGTDFPGHARDWIAAAYPDAEAVFLQGFAGDIKPRAIRPRPGLTPSRFGGVLVDELQTKQAVGWELGRAVLAAVSVPPPPVPADRPKDLEQALATPVTLGGVLELVDLPTSPTDPAKMTPVPFHMGALRIGDVYMFCGQGEILSSMALRIKRNMPDMRVWTNAYCHTIGGSYIGDAESWDEGGYEAGRYAPQAEDVLVSHAMQFIRGLQYQPIHTDPIPRTHPTYCP